jgi:hypothetical protein
MCVYVITAMFPMGATTDVDLLTRVLSSSAGTRCQKEMGVCM